MTGYKYTYLTTEEIFKKITYISSEPFPGIIFILIAIIIIIIVVNNLFPFILFSIEKYKKELSKKKRKKLMRQIILQKEVEDEIQESFKK